MTSRLHASHDIASAFTPGPWTVFSDDDCRYDHLPGIEALDGELSIVVVGYPDDDSCGVHGRNSDEAVANARLIAAAPDLYEALAVVMERFDWGGHEGEQPGCPTCELFSLVSAALAQAREVQP